MSDFDLDYRDAVHPSEKAPRQRRKNKKQAPPSTAPDPSSLEDNSSMPRTPHKITAVSSSLDSIHVPPRTPRTAYGSDDGKAENGIELSLLSEDERRAAAMDEDDVDVAASKVKSVSGKDKRGMALLIVLCESIILAIETLLLTCKKTLSKEFL